MRRQFVLRTGLVLALTALTFTHPAAAAADEPAQTLVASAQATIGGYPVWAHFNNPHANNDRDNTIHLELERLIDAAPENSTIRGTIHSISIPSVGQALKRAQDRRVRVMVVVDGKNTDLTNGGVAAIKQLTEHKFCSRSSGGRACISSSGDGDMHTKMFTFTATKDPNGTDRTNVSWFGSANLTYATGPDSFNNTVTVYGDAALMNGLNANFADMWNQRQVSGNDYYDAASGRGYYQATAADAYASPEAAGQTDTIVTRLNDATPDANCRLRIGMSFVTAGRPGITNLVKRFKAAGCQIWVVVGTTSTGDINMTRSVYDDLLGAGVKIRSMDKVHDKFFALYAKFGSAYQYRVYTGSQNWSQDALSENDEIFVKMGPESGTTHPLYNGFYNHFNDAYNNGVTCTTSNFPCK
ncbi:phospholipase D-like domain-containing protein [Actinoplanes sp. TRM 88003]|uniref:phospholipase D n=1 Tax=Paractinoplanes aksuensis TaxID=2939490 RepID=A0ABT1DZ42_9ACTN|nr:phospholipase D-like domain-containing protein [Actinoplanes aksuensis]MCO8274901.1 phospholipase D-like domain-containing protein [Actinoplanes aksuensis]